jgi:cell wall-associated NlpC family hydrolase
VTPLCVRVCVAALLLVLSASCGPKKVALYERASEIRNNIVQSAVALHGRPYRSGGKGPGAFDCSGLVHYVYKIWGIAVPASTEGLGRSGREADAPSVQAGDLVFFKIKEGAHVGIMLNKVEFIHASKGRGVGVDSVRSAYWRSVFRGFRSLL